jgi:hypothetical protein
MRLSGEFKVTVRRDGNAFPVLARAYAHVSTRCRRDNPPRVTEIRVPRPDCFSYVALFFGDGCAAPCFVRFGS